MADLAIVVGDVRDRRDPAPGACRALTILHGVMGYDTDGQPRYPTHLYHDGRCGHCGREMRHP